MLWGSDEVEVEVGHETVKGRAFVEPCVVRVEK